MVKKRKWFSFRLALIILTMALVAYVVYQNWPDILDTFYHLKEANIFVLMAIVPEQIMMYYACGQIFFAYLKRQKNVKRFSRKEMLSISTELNFVNHAVPAGGVGGLAYLSYRLKPFGVSVGQASFLYVFRYAITTVINYLQALIAVFVMLILGMIPNEAKWVIPVALLMNMGILTILWLIIYIAKSKKRTEFFSRTVEKIMNNCIKIVTFGKKRTLIRRAIVDKYFSDIHENVKIAKQNKKDLKGPLIWGFIYSFLEVTTYWIVAISLGRPDILPFILIGEAIGSVFDGIVPYGLYELGMAGVMIALGVEFPIATLTTVMTRVLTLILTILTGIIPYSLIIKRKDSTT
ncbi:MAG: lysylphosphatidylglycerol synthase domain-containing protein [Candidatus Saccharibacteria bacterium]|nr:lysylphosphatidylglycerol synthase domain-containing protein [Candidatus Saccharibacteria bacterium]